MKQEEILSGSAGLAGIHQALHGQSSRRLLRNEVQRMLRPGFRAGPFRLTRAKFKPGRKLNAYFNFPVFSAMGKVNGLVHLAVTWKKNLDSDDHAEAWRQLQEEADRSGLMPVQCDLWRDLPERGARLEIWPFDPEFPHLVRLGNPSHVAELFASLDVAPERKDLPEVTPIRYR